MVPHFGVVPPAALNHPSMDGAARRRRASGGTDSDILSCAARRRRAFGGTDSDILSCAARRRRAFGGTDSYENFPMMAHHGYVVFVGAVREPPLPACGVYRVVHFLVNSLSPDTHALADRGGVSLHGYGFHGTWTQ